MPRAKLYTSSDMVSARLVESRLKELGLPVAFQYGRTGGSWFLPGGPYEVWIQDATLLDKPEIREQIRVALQPATFTPEEESEIAEMPLEDKPTEVGYGILLAAFVAGLILLILLFRLIPWLWVRIVGP